MDTISRKLNSAGIDFFRDYIRNGAEGPPPVEILNDHQYSEPIGAKLQVGSAKFEDRYHFGIYVRTLLKDLDASTISRDRGLWSTLGLLWFDRLCPADKNGNRSPKEEYYYILSADYRHYYRHLVRSPWQLVRDHGDNARFLLISPRKQEHPLSIHGEILEQFGGRQQVLASQPIVAAANKMYFDTTNGVPKRGVAGSGRGSARRFGLVLRQLDLTYDPTSMDDQLFFGILPKEFEKWLPQTEA
ncbi:hypothetical protein [Oricola indica]|jgi:hypothetical protein|uniref:hypothetical protein n=1 Tax=Oricola indica TaxID=2872591 RepID=UPI001CBEBCB1|nr:hypothetical protein [Oricola indica]